MSDAPVASAVNNGLHALPVLVCHIHNNSTPTAAEVWVGHSVASVSLQTKRLKMFRPNLVASYHL